MPASFDDEMTINDHGCLTPSGPLGLAAGETGWRLDIWIFQGRSACMAFLLNPKGDKWMMNPNPDDDHFGEPFQPGPAIAMGLIVKENNMKQPVVEQWSRLINLVK